MLIFNVIQEITACPSIIHSHHLGSQLWDLQNNWTLLAQHINDSDLLGNFQKAFNSFIQSGQGWALLIGLIIGYIIRGFTSYG
jgi:hypothetical protein